MLDGLVRGVPHADLMDFILLPARDLDSAISQLSMFAVSLDAPGIRLRRLAAGLSDAPLFEILATDVALGSEHLIGPLGAAERLIDFCLSIPWSDLAKVSELQRTASKIFAHMRESDTPHPCEEQRDLEWRRAELEIELHGLEYQAQRIATSRIRKDRLSGLLLKLELGALQKQLGELALGVVAYGALSSHAQLARTFGCNLPPAHEADSFGAAQIYFQAVGAASVPADSIRTLDLAAMEILEGYDG